MGTYATTTSLEMLMVGTTFDTATTTLCTRLITHAENEINKYLSKRYDISALQAAVPPLVTSLCETLTEGYMTQRRSRGGKEALAQGVMLIKMAIDNLTAISEYEMDLLDSSGNVIADMPNTSYRVLNSTDDYVQTFDEGRETAWVVDPNKIDDINGRKA